MARPRTLTDEQRKTSNAKRQAKWRLKHGGSEKKGGFARMKERNAKRAKRETEGVGVEPSKVSPKKVTGDMPHYGELVRGTSFDDVERNDNQANKSDPPAAEAPNQLPEIEIEMNDE